MGLNEQIKVKYYQVDIFSKNNQDVYFAVVFKDNIAAADNFFDKASKDMIVRLVSYYNTYKENKITKQYEDYTIIKNSFDLDTLKFINNIGNQNDYSEILKSYPKNDNYDSILKDAQNLSNNILKIIYKK